MLQERIPAGKDGILQCIKKDKSKNVNIKLKCPEEGCGKTFMKHRLKKHLQNVHASKKPCPHCQKMLAPKSFRQHLRLRLCQITSDEMFACTESGCTIKLKTMNSLKYHIKFVHHSQRIQCPIPGCDHKIKPGSIKSHEMMVHQKLKSTCGNCGKRLSKFGVKKHLKVCTNTGERIFECEIEGCKAKFKLARHVKDHLRAVHQAKIKCPHKECSAIFSPCYLPCHIRSVHDLETRECRFCHRNIKYFYLKKHETLCERIAMRRKKRARKIVWSCFEEYNFFCRFCQILKNMWINCNFHVLQNLS